MELPIIQIDIVAATQIGIIRAQLVRIDGIKIGRVCGMFYFRYIGRLLLAHVRKIDALEELVCLDLIHALAQPLVRRSAQSPY